MTIEFMRSCDSKVVGGITNPDITFYFETVGIHFAHPNLSATYNHNGQGVMIMATD